MIEFDDFWSQYPRKVSKGTARKAWAKALKLASPDAIMAGLNNSIAFWEREATATTFIPHASTWLNGERWEDEYPVPQLTPLEIMRRNVQ